jgi:hypothetical protein
MEKVIDMPTCAVCGMESTNLARCKICGDRFCEECGDKAEKICLFCLDDETGDWSDDFTDTR